MKSKDRAEKKQKNRKREIRENEKKRKGGKIKIYKGKAGNKRKPENTKREKEGGQKPKNRE